MNSKACTKCGAIKPLSEFGKNKRFKDGYQCGCKDCLNKERRDWSKKNPEKNKNFKREDAIKHKKRYIEKSTEWNKNAGDHRKKIARKSAAQSCLKLKEYYIAKLLADLGFTPELITPELIELKREQLKILRLSKQLKKSCAR